MLEAGHRGPHVFTSDNGPVIDDGYEDGALEALGDHDPSGSFRGGKYHAWEGGTRMPFIVRWPSRVKPGEPSASSWPGLFRKGALHFRGQYKSLW